MVPLVTPASVLMATAAQFYSDPACGVALTESLDDQNANSVLSFTFNEPAVFNPKAKGRLGLPVIVDP